MVQVGVQRGSQGRASVDQSDPRMTPAMDSPLVAFGLAKPPFQVDIVSRQLIDRPHKQPPQKAGHQSRHVPREGIMLFGESSAEFLKLTATVLLRTLKGIECIGNGLDLRHLRPQFTLNLLDGRQPAVNACR